MQHSTLDAPFLSHCKKRFLFFHDAYGICNCVVMRLLSNTYVNKEQNAEFILYISSIMRISNFKSTDSTDLALYC